MHTCTAKDANLSYRNTLYPYTTRPANPLFRTNTASVVGGKGRARRLRKTRRRQHRAALSGEHGMHQHLRSEHGISEQPNAAQQNVLLY